MIKIKRKLFYQLLIVILAIACGIPANRPAAVPPSAVESSLSPPADLEVVSVNRVIDGDTIELTDGRRIRYIGINTPEHGQPYYEAATNLNRQLVEGQELRLELDEEPFDRYNRTLAYVWVGDQLVNLEIVQQGFANAFFIPPNNRYETEIRQAEAEAHQAKQGIWQEGEANLKITRIEADAPGPDNENPNGEWIEIMNQGNQSIDMTNFTIKDEANNIYQFDSFTLPPDDIVRLHSGTGQDDDETLYWGLVNQSVWNNKGDAAFLRDAKGALVDQFEY
jgi:micrococcal nuclease